MSRSAGRAAARAAATTGSGHGLGSPPMRWTDGSRRHGSSGIRPLSANQLHSPRTAAVFDARVSGSVNRHPDPVSGHVRGR